MVFGERVGHIQPVYAVVHTGVPVRVPKASSGQDSVKGAIILDSAEHAGELAREVNLREVNLFLHCPYYTGAE